MTSEHVLAFELPAAGSAEPISDAVFAPLIVVAAYQSQSLVVSSDLSPLPADDWCSERRSNRADHSITAGERRADRS
jgi:hypothetical protein